MAALNSGSYQAFQGSSKGLAYELAGGVLGESDPWQLPKTHMISDTCTQKTKGQCVAAMFQASCDYLLAVYSPMFVQLALRDIDPKLH